MIPKQSEMLEQEPWDVLIILDACRYDTFEQVYPKWLKGTLTKVKSFASTTHLWLSQTWPLYYDYVYVSANPYINSQGVPIHKYIAKDHFHKIINVWNFGWSEKLGTVPPINVNKAVLEVRTEKRMIIHYAQPHQPYIGRSGAFTRSNIPFRAKILHQPINRIHQGSTGKLLPYQAYVETLDLALQRVSELVPHLDGKIIISADHGEMFGEIRGKTGHPPRVNHKVLREVPWFEVAHTGGS